MINFERLFRTRSLGKRRTLLKVLRWVAYSVRPLEVHELLVAISTNTELDKVAPNAEAVNTEPSIGTQEDLLAICGGLLGRSDEGTIHFVHESVRDFVRSPAMRVLDAWEDCQIHEMIAVVCLRHVTCLDETAVLRPWAQAGKELRDPTRRCYLRDYSALHWHQHFRLAEPTSMYLPSLLYRILQAAFQKVDSRSGIAEGMLMVERRIDQGLDFCCRHDFLRVGKMFLEMGARTNSPWISAAHIAAAFGSTNLLEFLIGSQVRSDDYEQLSEAYSVPDAYSPVELAAFHGRTAAVELLLQVKTSIHSLSESDWASAYIIAAEYGHQEVVRTFLKCATHPRHTQEADHRALRLAEELEHDSIIELISTYRSVTHPDFNMDFPLNSLLDHPCGLPLDVHLELNFDDHPELNSAAVFKARNPAMLHDLKSPQKMVSQTLQPRLRDLDLDRHGLADVKADISGSDELDGWSLVEYPDIDTIVEAHMDMENG
jgi:hypothetical protein